MHAGKMENKRKAISPTDRPTYSEPGTSDDGIPLTDLTKGELRSLISEISIAVNTASRVKINDSIKEVLDEVKLLRSENEKLREELEQIKYERKQDRRELSNMQDQLRRKNVIFKGMSSSNAVKEAVEKVCVDNLKLSSAPSIKSSKKIFDRNGKMGVVVELDSEDAVYTYYTK